jgi:alkaline phosphatase
MKNKHINNKTLACSFIRVALSIFMLVISLLLIPGSSAVYGGEAKHIILVIADGWGVKHLEATNAYTGTTPSYQNAPWNQHWLSTFPSGGSYDTTQAWSDFDYVKTGAITDSAAAASALYSGMKTQNRRISVSTDASTAFYTIGERAKDSGMAVGAVSTVPVSHATPGAWVAHNDDRGNTYAIADEGFFGNPNETGTTATDPKYGGGHGTTLPAADVLIGTNGATFVSSQILVKLRNDSGQVGKHVLVERQTGVDAGDALMAAANNVNTKKLAGLFDHVYKNADNSGADLELPTLSESTAAALKVLNKNENGFVLMIEGGAVDWAGHANNMDHMIGEHIDFDNAIQTVIDWIDDPSNGSDWSNSLVVVTGDHEAGYLAASNNFITDPLDLRYDANDPLGKILTVNASTLAMEEIVSDSGGRRASWDDIDLGTGIPETTQMC